MLLEGLTDMNQIVLPGRSPQPFQISCAISGSGDSLMMHRSCTRMGVQTLRFFERLPLLVSSDQSYRPPLPVIIIIFILPVDERVRLANFSCFSAGSDSSLSDSPSESLHFFFTHPPLPVYICSLQVYIE